MMERLQRAKDKMIQDVEETVDIGDMIAKIDEIVSWINENENKEKR